MNTPIYLDYAATTPVDPEVAELMVQCLTVEGNFGNPASRSHLYGWKAEEAVELARKQVASLIGADTREVVWTSGATESNNLAIKGAVEAFIAANPGVLPHVITSSIEHKSVLDTCEYLNSKGCDVSYIAPQANGCIDPQALISAIRSADAASSTTAIVSIMHANNETGAINDVKRIGKACRELGVLFHVDAAQTLAKISVDVSELQVDLLSLSAHKMYGPKGIGALYVRRSPDVSIVAQMHGGGHERGMRSGTLATHQIVGMGKAAELALAKQAEEEQAIRALREQFLVSLEELEGVTLNGVGSNTPLAQSLPGITNLSFSGIDGETLLMTLRDLAISSGSACMSASVAPSYVLSAMGLSDELANSSLRFSFGRYTTQADIQFAVKKVKQAIAALSATA